VYQDRGLTEEEFLSSRYLRIKTISEHQEAGHMDEKLRWTTGNAPQSARTWSTTNKPS
jgi:hypothetical protein